MLVTGGRAVAAIALPVILVGALAGYRWVQKVEDKYDSEAQSRNGAAFAAPAVVATNRLAKGRLTVDDTSIRWEPVQGTAAAIRIGLDQITSGLIVRRGWPIRRTSLGIETLDATYVFVTAARLQRAMSHPALGRFTGSP
jgi:hypothetical protein